MGTFVQIGIYSAAVLAGVSAAAAAFIYVSLWIVNQSEDNEGH